VDCQGALKKNFFTILGEKSVEEFNRQLQQPYLSEVFFEVMDIAVEAAEEHGS
jgi:hypothetical protein